MLQVPCPNTSNIIVNVDQYRASGGGWIKLSFKKVAGDGGLTYVGIAGAGSDQVSSAAAVRACGWQSVPGPTYSAGLWGLDVDAEQFSPGSP